MNGWMSGGSPINQIRDGAMCSLTNPSRVGECNQGLCTEVASESEFEDFSNSYDSEYDQSEQQNISKSVISCDIMQMEYPGTFKYNSESYLDVCGDVNWPSQSCTQISQINANELCLEHGLRLCKFEEVLGGVLAGSGCTIRRKRVWTRTKCVEGDYRGFIAAIGKDGSSASCRPGSEEFNLACCGDR